MGTAYYNEIDPYAAQWLRNLIQAGHIAPGYVDERSIEDVYPSDLRGFTQCHFFAGIGVWSHSLRLAGWSDDRPVWTGSCPCQPFSAAGKGTGFDDERHLWPSFQHLIKECHPAIVLGEQVASSDAGPWIDLVHTDLEELGYAFGAVPFPSAGVGAPHIRDRLYWVAHASNVGRIGRLPGSPSDGRDAARQQSERLCNADRLADTERHDCGSQAAPANHRQSQADRPANRTGGRGGAPGGLGHADSDRAGRDAGSGGSAQGEASVRPGRDDARAPGASLPAGPGPTNGLWADADWLCCRDGKWRPVEPGSFPMAHGAAARVGRLRAYGNAINAKAAQAFIECVMDL